MRKYRDYLIEELADREKAISYLQTALEEYQTDGDMPALLLALRSVVEAQGGIQDEYQFDYSKAKPNRLADKVGREQLMVVLNQDVAAVFGSQALTPENPCHDLQRSFRNGQWPFGTECTSTLRHRLRL